MRPSSLGTRSVRGATDATGLADAVETKPGLALSAAAVGPAAGPVVSDVEFPSGCGLHANASRMT